MKSLRKLAAQIQHDDQPCELEYVGFWARAFAGLIDLGLVTALIFPLLQLADRGVERFLMGGMPTLLALFLFFAALSLFYLSPGSTPGMVAISAMVVDERTGCPPAMPQRLGRCLALMLSVVPLGLGCIWAAFHPKKQGWHDKLAGTIVVRARGGTQRPFAPSAPPAAKRHDAATIGQH